MEIQTKQETGFSLSGIIAFLLCAALLLIGYFYFPHNILCWDVFGYYLYLPLTFIYNDLGLKDPAIIDTIIQKYNNTSSFYQALPSPTGTRVMRYSIGLSLLYSPFFFIGHVIAKVGGYPADGFSVPYQYAIWCGSMIFAFVGIFIIRKVLLKFFSEKMVSFLLVLLIVGTNYTLHTSVHGQGAMPHDYLFTLYAFILWFTIRWHESYKLNHAIGLAIACGLAILSRPSETVCLLIPMLWGIHDTRSLFEKMSVLKRRITHVIVFATILTGIGFIQFSYWKIYTGSFIFDSYSNPGEGLDLFPPHTINSLFSFRNGWFIYTPVMMLAMVGFFFLYKKDKPLFGSIFAFFLVNLWIVTSWTVWWNGPSFGQRYLIASYPALSIPLGYFFVSVSERNTLLKKVSIAIAFFCVGLNLFQSWQMTTGILPTPRMTQDAYFAAFGETEIPEGIEKLLHIDPLSPGAADINPADYEKTNTYTEDFENCAAATQDSSVSLSKFLKMDSVCIYSPNIEKKYSKLSDKDHVKMKISLQLYSTTDPKENPGSLVVSFEHKERTYGYTSIDVEKQDCKLNTWHTVSFNYITPVIRSGRDQMKVYYWHRGKKPVFIDNLQVEIWEKKD